MLGVGQYAGPNGLDLSALATFSFVWGMGGAIISLQLSRWIAKRATGISLVDGRTGRAELDWLFETVKRLTEQAGLPMPEVGVYDSAELNAFATGPSKRRSLVAVTSGLLRGMRQNEIEAVLAHEVSHIANGDMVTMTLLQGVINAFVIFFARLVAFAIRQSDSRNSHMLSFVVMIVLEIGLGILGSMVTAWYSRQREFRADAGASSLSGRENMIAALRRLATQRNAPDQAQQALATLKINGSRGWMVLLATHPPLEDRISALEAAAS